MSQSNYFDLLLYCNGRWVPNTVSARLSKPEKNAVPAARIIDQNLMNGATKSRSTGKLGHHNMHSNLAR